MLVISSNLVLSPAEAALPAGTPMILYENLVTLSNVSATSADMNYPITNVANPATNQEWRAAAIASPIDIDVAVNSIAPVDAVGIARHNFGSTGIAVSIYAVTAGPSETLLVGPQIPPNDEPLLFQFTAQSFETLRIRLTGAPVIPRAAVLYVGKLLITERGFNVPDEFSPPRFARKTEHVNGTSHAGDFLGRIITSQAIDGAVFNWKHFTPDWYRTYFDPFVRVAQRDTPFFFAWAPDDYPYEVAFGWLTADPVAQAETLVRPNRMNVSIRIGGIVE